MTQSSGDVESGPSAVETNEGVGTWVGVVETADGLRDRFAERRDRFEEALERQIERYRWFEQRVESPRPVRRCAEILRDPGRPPGAWERAMVELTLVGKMRAQMVLEDWEPLEPDPDLELFWRVCLTQLTRRNESGI